MRNYITIIRFIYKDVRSGYSTYLIASENDDTSLKIMKKGTALNLWKYQDTVGDIPNMEGCDLVLRLGRIGRCKVEDALIQVGDR